VNRSTSSLLTAAVLVPTAVLFAMAGTPAQASIGGGSGGDPVKGSPAQAAGLDRAVSEVAQEFAIAQDSPVGGTGKLVGRRHRGAPDPLYGHIATLLGGGPVGSLPAGGLHRLTDATSGTLPMDPAAVPGQPFRVAGTAKDALPAGLGDTAPPGPLSGGSGGLSGLFGGLPGLGGAVPANTLYKLPVTPQLG
jgi:hypothetical protein